MKAILGEQFVEVVAGDAARDAGKLLTDQVGVAIAQARQSGVDRPFASSGADDAPEFIGRSVADGHTRPVVENDVEGLDVVDCLSAEEAMHAAAVVADHAAEGATGVSRRIGCVGQVVLLGGVAQAVENDAGLDGRQLCLRVD